MEFTSVMVIESMDLRYVIRGYHGYKNFRILELGEVLTAKKKHGNIHDRFACGVYLMASFISLVVNVGGGVYSRAT